jgi:uncharacterized protein DUF5658
MAVLLVYFSLQLCDLATTMLFMRHGIGEGNPLVAALIRISDQPAVALVLVKAVGCGLAVYAWRSRRMRFLRRANLFFALCVCWNLLAIAGA